MSGKITEKELHSSLKTTIDNKAEQSSINELSSQLEQNSSLLQDLNVKLISLEYAVYTGLVAQFFATDIMQGSTEWVSKIINPQHKIFLKGNYTLEDECIVVGETAGSYFTGLDALFVSPQPYTVIIEGENLETSILSATNYWDRSCFVIDGSISFGSGTNYVLPVNTTKIKFSSNGAMYVNDGQVIKKTFNYPSASDRYFTIIAGKYTWDSNLYKRTKIKSIKIYNTIF